MLLAHREQINLALFQYSISCPKFNFSIKEESINSVRENKDEECINSLTEINLVFFIIV